MKTKLRQITSGLKHYAFPFDPGEEHLADDWLAKQRAKDGFLTADHTVEDIDNPDFDQHDQFKKAINSLDNTSVDIETRMKRVQRLLRKLLPELTD